MYQRLQPPNHVESVADQSGVSAPAAVNDPSGCALFQGMPGGDSELIRQSGINASRSGWRTMDGHRNDNIVGNTLPTPPTTEMIQQISLHPTNLEWRKCDRFPQQCTEVGMNAATFEGGREHRQSLRQPHNKHPRCRHRQCQIRHLGRMHKTAIHQDTAIIHMEFA